MILRILVFFSSSFSRKIHQPWLLSSPNITGYESLLVKLWPVICFFAKKQCTFWVNFVMFRTTSKYPRILHAAPKHPTSSKHQPPQEKRKMPFWQSKIDLKNFRRYWDFGYGWDVKGTCPFCLPEMTLITSLHEACNIITGSIHPPFLECLPFFQGMVLWSLCKRNRLVDQGLFIRSWHYIFLYTVNIFIHMDTCILYVHTNT